MSRKKWREIWRAVCDTTISALKAIRGFVVKISGVRRKGFVDYNNIGMDTRDAVLFRDATKCTLTKSNGKITITGSWKCKYSGKVFTNARELDIDHIVPLHYAKNHKIGIWTPAKFQEFENDTDNLIAVDKKLNRAKRDKSIVHWKPPKSQSWYRSRWKEICKKWMLEHP